MDAWRAIFGFKPDEDLVFGEVHDRYRAQLLQYTSPISLEELKRLNDALESARSELGSTRVKS